MKATVDLAKQLGFRVARREDTLVMVSPDFQWVVTLQGKWTAFGPIDGKPWEERGHKSVREAHEFVRQQLTSINGAEIRS